MAEECFSLRKDGGCSALSVKACPGRGNCAFYKSYRKRKHDWKAARARLCTLPGETQREIAAKYHGGRMPWKGGRR